MDRAIKEAFQKVKLDFQFLYRKLNSLQTEFFEIKTEIQNLKKIISNLNFQNDFKKIHETANHLDFKSYNTSKDVQSTTIQSHFEYRATQEDRKPSISTYNPTQTSVPTENLPYYALKSNFIEVSTGNEGVPTDKQTNQQTDNRHIIKSDLNIKSESHVKKYHINHLEKAKEILESLDNLKKEIRIKFKQLTEQEMKIFALLYQLDSEGEIIDYSVLAKKTGLSESSIRDYIRKIILKGIPLQKEKLNNKRVLLSVSQDLKKIASLDTILKLRDI